ncbi:MAG: peptide-methionine (R)-S-oxide reductase MsrB [Flavobacteriaceae bacterium]|nr:peptide-methionine (R)-S-oxide reductase MsrB [Flavobacteriaceae bacterium]
MSDSPLKKSKTDWKKQLTSLEYHILIEKGTEAPFSGKYNDFYFDGHFVCKGCGQKLFLGKHKFQSGCGWPSFDQSIKGSVSYLPDLSHSMVRTEIICSHCGGHLGHIFEDGPTNTRNRYCVNSASIQHRDI